VRDELDERLADAITDLTDQVDAAWDAYMADYPAPDRDEHIRRFDVWHELDERLQRAKDDEDDTEEQEPTP
jgi:hypothetical protein